jgi:hypothetical protein
MRFFTLIRERLAPCAALFLAALTSSALAFAFCTNEMNGSPHGDWANGYCNLDWTCGDGGNAGFCVQVWCEAPGACPDGYVQGCTQSWDFCVYVQQNACVGGENCSIGWF